MYLFNRNIVLVFLMLFQALPAYAIDYFDTNITEDEKAVFAYLRLGDIVPDYDELIKGGHVYRGTPKKYQDEILLQEQLRLGRGYSEFDPDVNILKINAPIFVQFTTDEKGDHNVLFTFFRSEKSYTPTFDYPYISGEKISLIVNQLKNFSNLPVPDSQYDLIKEKAGAEEGQWFQAILDISVRATKADTATPHSQDGNLRWLMYGDVAYIKCMLPPKYGEEMLLWDWVAPWYEATFKEETAPEDEKYPHPFDLLKE